MEFNTAPLLGSIDPVITIGIIDNVPFALTLYTSLFNSFRGIRVILQANGGADAVRQLRAGCPRPDIILVDVTMLPMDGLETALSLLAIDPDLKLVVFTSAPEGLVYTKMMAAGCYGYLYKNHLPDVLEAELRRIHGMKDPGTLVEEARAQLLALSGHLHFTVEEQDRLQLYCQGYDNQVTSTVLDQKLDKLHQQQHRIVHWLSKLFSVLSKLMGRRRRKHLFLKDGYRWVRIAIADIVLIQGDDDYVRVRLKEDVLSNNKQHMYRTTLKALEEKLLGTELLRVNTSYIVNCSYIEMVEKKRTIWIGGEDIPLSDKYAASFYARLG